MSEHNELLSFTTTIGGQPATGSAWLRRAGRFGPIVAAEVEYVQTATDLVWGDELTDQERIFCTADAINESLYRDEIEDARARREYHATCEDRIIDANDSGVSK